ncbi:hypothetical protein [Bacillus wiedmannii]|uniref:Uncharacterized protein n=1 Tax=Bacillus wiedmannii TaxID=1890302 RepID=A0A2A7VVL5_9BACI|nr:hypothetical protein [Bacillus wiedmannii]PEJ04582.1 hypothetical protein CN684_22190 [Bacillus wiedmannii]PHC63925.1 hypothetical protein COF35_24270 [Bacillus wiedmannii]
MFNNCEIVSSFERNGKLYLILELDGKKALTSDLEVEVKRENDQLCITVKYKGTKIWHQCYALDICITVDKIPLGDFGFGKLWLEDVTICVENAGGCLRVKFDLWAKVLGQESKIGSCNDCFLIRQSAN